MPSLSNDGLPMPLGYEVATTVEPFEVIEEMFEASHDTLTVEPQPEKIVCFFGTGIGGGGGSKLVTSYSRWEMTWIFVVIIVACVLISAGAIAFAIKQRLCGHCVIWWRQSRELHLQLRQSISTNYKRMTSHGDETEDGDDDDIKVAIDDDDAVCCHNDHDDGGDNNNNSHSHHHHHHHSGNSNSPQQQQQHSNNSIDGNSDDPIDIKVGRFVVVEC